MPHERSYWLAYPDTSTRMSAFLLFREWMREECANQP
jgi:DNA-binding transcriptional LysR family regulator